MPSLSPFGPQKTALLAFVLVVIAAALILWWALAQAFQVTSRLVQ